MIFNISNEIFIFRSNDYSVQILKNRFLHVICKDDKADFNHQAVMKQCTYQKMIPYTIVDIVKLIRFIYFKYCKVTNNGLIEEKF